MSFFRRAWVLPGGHVDPGEELDSAALRELHEECGVLIENEKLDDYEAKVQPFCIFESTTAGKTNLPSTSHIIFFFQVKVQTKWQNIKMKYDY